MPQSRRLWACAAVAAYNKQPRAAGKSRVYWLQFIGAGSVTSERVGNTNRRQLQVGRGSGSSSSGDDGDCNLDSNLVARRFATHLLALAALASAQAVAPARAEVVAVAEAEAAAGR